MKRVDKTDSSFQFFLVQDVVQAHSQDFVCVCVCVCGGGGGGGAYLKNRDQIMNVLNETLC